MRTAIIIVGGFALLAICVAAARRLGGTSATGAGITVFIVAWLVIAAVNMWLGVARAGYTVREELPIFLLIFLVPAAAALFVRWRLS
jgi:hypothetical protein